MLERGTHVAARQVAVKEGVLDLREGGLEQGVVWRGAHGDAR